MWRGLGKQWFGTVVYCPVICWLATWLAVHRLAEFTFIQSLNFGMEKVGHNNYESDWVCQIRRANSFSVSLAFLLFLDTSLIFTSVFLIVRCSIASPKHVTSYLRISFSFTSETSLPPPEVTRSTAALTSTKQWLLGFSNCNFRCDLHDTRWTLTGSMIYENRRSVVKLQFIQFHIWRLFFNIDFNSHSTYAFLEISFL